MTRSSKSSAGRRRKAVPARPEEAPSAVAPARVALLDVARGLAIVAMIAYHVCFDLTYFGWADWSMLFDPRWIAWRASIVASFLFLVGVSLAMRESRAPDARWNDRAFVRRWLQIASAALAVTAGSALLFPASFIYFGVLHFVAVALWICRRASRRPGVAVACAAIVLAAGLCIQIPAFDPKWIDWLGFAVTKPETEDYVPLFPWLGVVLLGCAAGGYGIRHPARPSSWARVVDGVLPHPVRHTLATMGRWSLTIYLVHQPLLIGALALVRKAM